MNKLGNNFMNDDFVNKAYNMWIHGPTLFEHILDRERFYVFVKACVQYIKSIPFVKREVAWRELHREFLKERLSVDLAELREANFSNYEDVTHEIVSKFDFLIEYERTKCGYSRIPPEVEKRISYRFEG